MTQTVIVVDNLTEPLIPLGRIPADTDPTDEQIAELLADARARHADFCEQEDEDLPEPVEVKLALTTTDKGEAVWLMTTVYTDGSEE